MTTRRSAPPVLDRQITLNLPVTRTVAQPGAGYLFQQWNSPAAGEYVINGLNLWLHGPDRNGVALPAPDALPAGVMLTLEWDSMTAAGTLQHDAANRNQFGEDRPDWLLLRFTAALPNTGVNDLTISLPGSSTEVTTVTPVPVWAARRDVTGRDSLDLDADQRLIISLRRYIIRHRADVAADMTMVDDEGVARRIISDPGETGGRMRFLELLTEAQG